jgi:outer membrane lipoprotein-sorting protein
VRPLRATAIVVGALLLSGCLGAVRPPEPAPPDLAAIEPPEASEIFRILDERSASLRSFRGVADVGLRDPSQTLHGRQVVIVDRPDRLRIDVLSTFGVILQVASDGERIRAFDRGERTFYSGRASSPNLARFTRLDLRLSAIAGLLVGVPTAPRRTESARIELEPETALWRVTSPLEAGGTEHLWIDPTTFLPVRTELVGPRGVRQYDARFADWRVVAGVEIPHRIELDAPASETSITLSYTEVDVNPELRAALFRFEPPSGVTIVDLDA